MIAVIWHVFWQNLNNLCAPEVKLRAGNGIEKYLLLLLPVGVPAKKGESGCKIAEHSVEKLQKSNDISISFYNKEWLPSFDIFFDKIQTIWARRRSNYAPEMEFKNTTVCSHSQVPVGVSARKRGKVAVALKWKLTQCGKFENIILIPYP